MIEEDTVIDRNEWIDWSAADPMIKPERAAKGDILIGNPCEECDATGKSKITGLLCEGCKGKGRVGLINAVYTDNLGDIKFAQACVRNILNFLWEKEIITDQHHDDGHLFEAWRNQHRVALGQQKAISGDDTSSTGVKLRAYGFVLLLRRLSAYDQKAVNQSIDMKANLFTQDIAYREQNIYRSSFERLSTAIVPIKQQIAYLESLPEEERDDIANESLKKVLAKISRNDK